MPALLCRTRAAVEFVFKRSSTSLNQLTRGVSRTPFDEEKTFYDQDGAKKRARLAHSRKQRRILPTREEFDEVHEDSSRMCAQTAFVLNCDPQDCG